MRAGIDDRQRALFTHQCGALGIKDLVDQLPIAQTPAAPPGLRGQPHHLRVPCLVIALRLFLHWGVLHDDASDLHFTSSSEAIMSEAAGLCQEAAARCHSIDSHLREIYEV